MPTVAEVVAFLDAFAPPATAAEWDNVGLLVGDPADRADHAMTCLTVTPNVVDEAIAAGVQMIVAHHPVLFRGAKKLTPQTSDGRVLLPLLKAGIAVYSPHTAFDNCPGGINDSLARRLGIQDAKPLRPKDGRRSCKLVAFVPEGDRENVANALFAVGAGVIGQYEQCSFQIKGTGTFFGTAGANPTVGRAGQREHVAEVRLEFVIEEGRVEAAIAALRAAHSYEEPAFDVYPLRPVTSGGEGRIGELREAVTLAALARRANVELNANMVQRVGDADKLVRRIAVACGAAGEFLADAIRAKADVFVTGELRFHDALAAEAAGVGLILPGHYATERPAVEELAVKLQAELAGVEVWASRRERDSFALVTG